MLVKSVIIVLAAFLCISFVEGLIPNACVRNATTVGICCPIPRWSHEVCGGPKRGVCAHVKYTQETIPEIYKFDDRVEWPRRFFHSVCHCKGNFFGFDCGECWYGWEGRNCNKRKIIVRRNIKRLNKRDKNLLLKIIDRSLYVPSGLSVYIDKVNDENDPISKDMKWIPASIQYMLVFIHRFGSRSTMFEDYLDCQNFGILNFNHEAVGFITWHRFYMLLWERVLQKIAKRYFGINNFALPYWDWTDQTSCDICTNDMAGAPGVREPDGVRISERNPFSNWTEFCVEPDNSNDSPCYGCHVTGTYGTITREWNSFQFPTTADVQFTLSKRRYHVQGERVTDTACESFHRALEGMCGPPDRPSNLLYMHNRIHNMIDGSMCCSGTAPSDPLFIFHHIQIDRIFEEYLNRYNPTKDEFPNVNARPGHGRLSYMVSFLPPVTHIEMFTASKNLGYKYDSFNFGTVEVAFGPTNKEEDLDKSIFSEESFEIHSAQW